MAIKLIKKFEIGTYEERIKPGAVDRPHYGYCVYNAVILIFSILISKSPANTTVVYKLLGFYDQQQTYTCEGGA